MVRNLIIAVCACVYVAVSFGLVHMQGEAFREGLRRDRAAAVKAEKPAELKLDTPAPAPALAERTAARSETPTDVSAAETSAPKRPHEQSGTSASTKGKARTKRAERPVADSGKNPAVTDGAKHQAAAKNEPPSDPLAGDPFWNQPEMTRNWDLASLSVADEQKLGAQLHDVVTRLNPVASDGPWRQRLEQAAKPFLQTLIRKDVRYRFEVMESPEVNAFSHPGGYVYVSRGLFDLVGEDEDYALQFAVGNEIAHVDLQHAIKCLQDPDFKAMSGGTLRKLYWMVLPFGYLESQDYEADEWTFTRMRNFGRSRRESLAFLYKLDGYATKHGFRDGRGKVRMAPESSSFLDIHFRRQTAAWRRLEHLKEQIK